MKKYLNIILSLITITLCCIFPNCCIKRISLAENTDYASFNLVVDSDLQNMLSLSDGDAKTAGSTAEKTLAGYINDKMSALLSFKPNGKEDGYTKFEFINADGALMHSQNVIYLKDNPDTEKKVIIGTHYDTYSIKNGVTTQGVNANLSSVATLLEISRQLDTEAFDFDIEIVFFGAGEMGLYGAENYTKSIDADSAKKILLMINIEHILAGDYLNAYATGASSTMFDYVNGVAAELNVDLKKPVLAYSFVQDDAHFFNREYLHRGLYSNSAYFEKLGINTLFFFKGNESDIEALGKVESKTNADISNTENDTIAGIKALYGDDYMVSAYNTANIIKGLLNREDFMSFYEGSVASVTDVEVVIKIAFFSMAVLLVLFWLAYKLIYYRLFKIAHREASSARSLNQLFNKFSTEVENVDIDKEVEGVDIGEISNEFQQKVKEELNVEEKKSVGKKSKRGKNPKDQDQSK